MAQLRAESGELRATYFVSCLTGLQDREKKVDKMGKEGKEETISTSEQVLASRANKLMNERRNGGRGSDVLPSCFPRRRRAQRSRSNLV